MIYRILLAVPLGTSPCSRLAHLLAPPRPLLSSQDTRACTDASSPRCFVRCVCCWVGRRQAAPAACYVPGWSQTSATPAALGVACNAQLLGVCWWGVSHGWTGTSLSAPLEVHRGTPADSGTAAAVHTCGQLLQLWYCMHASYVGGATLSNIAAHVPTPAVHAAAPCGACCLLPPCLLLGVLPPCFQRALHAQAADAIQWGVGVCWGVEGHPHCGWRQPYLARYGTANWQSCKQV